MLLYFVMYFLVYFVVYVVVYFVVCLVQCILWCFFVVCFVVYFVMYLVSYFVIQTEGAAAPHQLQVLDVCRNSLPARIITSRRPPLHFPSVLNARNNGSGCDPPAASSRLLPNASPWQSQYARERKNGTSVETMFLTVSPDFCS